MRKFIYLFMFLFACTSYAQTEQISGQFRLIGTQEQPEADKVLTVDDNGDVGYMNNNRAARVDFNYSYTGNTNVNTNLDDFTVVVNDLEGFSINSGGDISLGEGIYLLSLYVSNNSFPSGTGYTSISSNIGGGLFVRMDEFIKYGGSSSKIIVIPTNINNGRINLTKQYMENLQGVATLSIVKIK